MPDLYCFSCKGNHSFSPTAIERIVYALTAALADAKTEPAEAGPAAAPMFWCLDDVANSAWSPEGYAEHVEQGLACRRFCATPGGGRM